MLPGTLAGEEFARTVRMGQAAGACHCTSVLFIRIIDGDMFLMRTRPDHVRKHVVVDSKMLTNRKVPSKSPFDFFERIIC